MEIKQRGDRASNHVVLFYIRDSVVRGDELICGP